MNVGVCDSGVAIGWMVARQRSLKAIEQLFATSATGAARLIVSVVNLAEILEHTASWARKSGVDPVALLRAHRVEIHSPDEAVARRVASLPTSLADGFAAATALELRARLHTTDAELVRQLRGRGLSISQY